MKQSFVALGECLIDFTPTPDGAYIPNVGGAPYNVAACVAKFGLSSSFFGKVGKDAFGSLIAKTAKSYGVNTNGIICTDGSVTSHAFVTLDAMGERDFVFCRDADKRLMYTEIDESLLDCGIFHFGTLSLTDEPFKSTSYKALQKAKDNGAVISFDPNYRALLWKSEADFVNSCKAVLDKVDVLKVSEEEAQLLEKADTALEAFARLAKGKLAFMTCGANGAYCHINGSIDYVPTVKVNTVDTTGAGDVFFATVIAQILKNSVMPHLLDIETVKRFTEKACLYATKSTENYGAVPKFAFNA